MSAFDDRRAQDVQKLHELERLSHGRVRITRVSGNPPNEIEVELQVKTVSSTDYPATAQLMSRIKISLPARYPLAEPSATISTPILHPNVYTSGRICLGKKWAPSFGLDLLVRRIAQIITFDPALVDLNPPANPSAASWYVQAVRKYPGAFPTDMLELSEPKQVKSISWTDATPVTPSKAVVTCLHCAAKLAIPTQRTGTVKCPKCGRSFSVGQ